MVPGVKSHISAAIRGSIIRSRQKCATGSHAPGSAGGTAVTYSESCTDTYQITATATNVCGNSATATPLSIFDSCLSSFRKSEASVALWSSDLKMEGGRLQVIVNGSTASYPERGRSFGTARIKDGENRMEMTVVDAAGKAGTWTIDLSGSESVQAGSIRVVAGDVVAISGSSVTFRLRGTPGERVAFTFNRK